MTEGYEELFERIEVLRAALREHGQHALKCRAYRQVGRFGSRSGLLWNDATDSDLCNCGLGAALAPPAPAKEETE